VRVCGSRHIGNLPDTRGPVNSAARNSVLSAMKPLLLLSMFCAPLFAGALMLEIGNPSANPEAVAKHAVVVARLTACKSPEKTIITATAEGVVDGTPRSIPLKVVPLSTAGTYALTREWPAEGTWTVKMIAMNPDYKDYATSVRVPIENGEFRWAAVKHFSGTPAELESK
jgi:hypothetical protein